MTDRTVVTDTDAKAAAQQLIEDVWNQGSLDKITRDEKYRQFVTELRVSFPDLRVSLDNIGANVESGPDWRITLDSDGPVERARHPLRRVPRHCSNGKGSAVVEG
jgi:hypothetical protein